MLQHASSVFIDILHLKCQEMAKQSYESQRGVCDTQGTLKLSAPQFPFQLNRDPDV